MGNTKIAFFDVDGTMIHMGAKKMTDKMVHTLNKLKEDGVKICVATGRPAILLPHFPGVEFDAFLTYNGSYCYTKEENIYQNPIPKEDVKQIIKNAKNIEKPVVLAGEHRIGGNGADEDLLEYFGGTEQGFDIIDDFNELAEEEIYQMMVSAKPHEYEDLLEDANGAEITAWWHKAVDIIPANGGKGLAVEKMLEYYEFSKDEAIAFGDGTNDIEMLETVGTGVAMGNATDNVKERADIVCGNCIDDGIYYYCKENNLI